MEATAAPFAQPIREHAPFLWEELDGMARGSGLPISRLLILQARAEVMRANRPAAPPPPECTTFGVTGHRTAGGATLIGQNVDLVPFVEEFGVVIRQYPKDAPAALLYTTAGLLGHNGLNEAGVGVCANFVDDPDGWGDGLPRYLLSRLALREASAEAACAAALAPPRAASRNLLIADDRGTIVDVEALRRRAAILRARDGLLVHANHLEAAEFQGCEKPSENSLARRARLAALFEAARAPRDRRRHPGLLPRPRERAAQPLRAPVPRAQSPDGRLGDRRPHQPRAARQQGRAVPIALRHVHPRHLPDGRPLGDGPRSLPARRPRLTAPQRADRMRGAQLPQPSRNEGSRRSRRRSSPGHTSSPRPLRRRGDDGAWAYAASMMSLPTVISSAPPDWART